MAKALAITLVTVCAAACGDVLSSSSDPSEESPDGGAPVDASTDASTLDPDAADADPPPPPGTLDQGFANGPKAGLPLVGIRALAVQKDGKIYLAGVHYQCVGAGTGFDVAVVRLAADGSSLDATWGTSGRACWSTPGEATDDSQALLVDANGRLVVAGDSVITSTMVPSAARFDTSGKGVDWTYVRDPAAGAAVFTGIATPGTGYFLSGTDNLNAQLATSAFLLALSDFGQPTGIFGNTPGDSRYTSGAHGYFATASPAADRLIAVGASNADPTDFEVVTLDAKGAPSATFGGGTVTSPVSASGHDDARSVAVQGDGKVLVAGPSDVGGSNATAVVRYTSTGAIDTTFGAAGTYVSPKLRWQDLLQRAGMVLQPDGRIVLVGVVDTGDPTKGLDVAVERLDANGALDTTFGAGGRVELSLPKYDQAIGVALDPTTKKIVVLGLNNDTSRYALYRINP